MTNVNPPYQVGEKDPAESYDGDCKPHERPESMNGAPVAHGSRDQTADEAQDHVANGPEQYVHSCATKQHRTTRTCTAYCVSIEAIAHPRRPSSQSNAQPAHDDAFRYFFAKNVFREFPEGRHARGVVAATIDLNRVHVLRGGDTRTAAIPGSTSSCIQRNHSGEKLLDMDVKSMLTTTPLKAPPTSSAPRSQPVGRSSSGPKLSLAAVVVLIYYEVRTLDSKCVFRPVSQVCGGPFGVEDAVCVCPYLGHDDAACQVGAGGPLLAIAGFVVLPLVLPILHPHSLDMPSAAGMECPGSSHDCGALECNARRQRVCGMGLCSVWAVLGLPGGDLVLIPAAQGRCCRLVGGRGSLGWQTTHFILCSSWITCM